MESIDTFSAVEDALTRAGYSLVHIIEGHPKTLLCHFWQKFRVSPPRNLRELHNFSTIIVTWIEETSGEIRLDSITESTISDNYVGAKWATLNGKLLARSRQRHGGKVVNEIEYRLVFDTMVRVSVACRENEGGYLINDTDFETTLSIDLLR